MVVSETFVFCVVGEVVGEALEHLEKFLEPVFIPDNICIRDWGRRWHQRRTSVWVFKDAQFFPVRSQQPWLSHFTCIILPVSSTMTLLNVLETKVGLRLFVIWARFLEFDRPYILNLP